MHLPSESPKDCQLEPSPGNQGSMLQAVLSAAASSRPGFTGLLISFCLAGTLGCAKNTSVPPWPERPVPAYPRPTGPTDPASGEGSGSGTEANPAASSAPLAEQYSGGAVVSEQTGRATYYSDSLAGNHTANGDVYDPKKFTAAHRKLPFGTVVRVTRTDTRAVTYVTINDRGPFGSNERVIDVSRAAAQELAMLKAGVVPVMLEVLDRK